MAEAPRVDKNGKAVVRTATIRDALSAMPTALCALVCAYAAPPTLRILPWMHVAAHPKVRAPDEVRVDLNMHEYRLAEGRLAATEEFVGIDVGCFVVLGVTEETALREVLATVRATPLTRDSFIGRLADFGVASAVEVAPALSPFGAAATHVMASLDRSRPHHAIPESITFDEEGWCNARAALFEFGGRLTLQLGVQRYASRDDAARLYSWREVATWFGDGLVPTWPSDRSFGVHRDAALLRLDKDDPTFCVAPSPTAPSSCTRDAQAPPRRTRDVARE